MPIKWGFINPSQLSDIDNALVGCTTAGKQARELCLQCNVAKWKANDKLASTRQL